MTEMITIASALETQICERCGELARLVGIEPHPRFAGADLRTYLCDYCDETGVVVVPLPPASPAVRKK